MQIFHSLLAECAEPLRSNDKIKFLASDFIIRLLLFDRYILDSLRLQEIPSLVDIFGYSPTLELIKSNKILIRLETFAGYGSTGRYRNLPLSTYSLDPLAIHPYSSRTIGRNNSYMEDQEAFIRKNLEIIDEIEGISSKEANELTREIASSIVSFKNRSFVNKINSKCSEDFGLIDPSIKKGIAIQSKHLVNKDIDPREIRLDIDFPNESKLLFHIDSNLESKFSINEEKSHEIMERALLGVTRINTRFQQMQEYNCQVGFKDNEAEIINEKFKFLASKFSEDQPKENITNILRIKGLPNLEEALQNETIDLIKVLEIAELREWREFRDWLLSQDNINEEELQDMISSLPQRIRDYYEKKTTQIGTFLVSTGIGLLSPAAGITMSMIDKFIIDRILPRKGAITFINNSLPSIFSSPPNTKDIKIMEADND